VEIENWPGTLQAGQIKRRMACSAAWNDEASAFHCSDDMLNRIWDLCRYSVKATTFAGIYVDGDRERIAYEADAYLAQISDYYTDGETQMARDTFDRLMAHPTWPSEWAPHMIFIAYADWMQTGDTNWLAPRYASLKSKLQFDREGPDGLIGSTDGQIKSGDVVDWPTGERNGFVFTHSNTVVNAFHLRALKFMAELARALQQSADADEYEKRERTAHQAFQDRFFDPARQLYRDGVGTDHTSLHANLFPLAFGLVPEPNRARVTGWLVDRGMACSVYAAQYLMEGLFENQAGSEAIRLITASNDRSWRHMIESGTTITWEAWDQHYKTNQDWNHAWGAAPANLLPRFVLGVQPAAPGWKRVVVRPNTSSLESATGKVPSPLGPIQVEWHNAKEFSLTLSLPPGMRATVQLPVADHATGLWLDGQPAHAHRQGDDWILDDDVTGTVKIEAR